MLIFMYPAYYSCLSVALILLWFSGTAYAQINEDEHEPAQIEEVEANNVIYKPVVAIGFGAFNFMGDVNDFHNSLITSYPGFKLNVSTYVDARRDYRLNFFFLYGQLSGNERSFKDLQRNLNFRSEIINFGLNFEYTFNHLLPSNRRISPFISVGAESFQFNSKADLHDSQGRPYNYWSDGTIRDLPENSGRAHESVVIQRNYIYETDLRSADLYGLGNYPQIALALPVNYGLDFKISERMSMRVASSIHFTFTDMIDNVSYAGTGITGSRRNDRFSYSYVSFHLDLFSDSRALEAERILSDNLFEYYKIEDTDGDGVFDFWDKCPGTPPGVEVDEYGCPIDSDGDGVPDYLDLEPNTPAGAFVDKHGREIAPLQLAEMLAVMENAISRDEALRMTPLSPGLSWQYQGAGHKGIPEKFRFLDTNNDGFISFEELIRAINIFFDGDSGLTVEDIYELNGFFFSQ